MVKKMTQKKLQLLKVKDNLNMVITQRKVKMMMKIHLMIVMKVMTMNLTKIQKKVMTENLTKTQMKVMTENLTMLMMEMMKILKKEDSGIKK